MAGVRGIRICRAASLPLERQLVAIGWWQGTAGLGFCGLIFAWNYWCRDRLSDWLIPYTGLARRLPWRSAQLITRIPSYGAPGIIAYAILRVVRPDAVLPLGISVDAALSGLVLGLCLMAASSALANGVFVIVHAATMRRRRADDARAELRVAKDSGWIRSYTLAYRSLPFPVFLLLTVVSVTGEEFAFRGIILPMTVRGFGFWPGYVITLAAFVGIQKMFMPSWRNAAIPMSGALVIGAMLGYLGLHGSGLLLLVMSHVGFFLATTYVLLAGSPGAPAAQAPAAPRAASARPGAHG